MRGSEIYLLFTHGGDDRDKKILALFKVRLDLFANVTLRNLDIVFLSAIRSHEIEETVVNVNLQALVEQKHKL